MAPKKKSVIYTNPPGSPVFTRRTRSFLHELYDFGCAMLNIGQPTISNRDLPLLPSAQIQEEMVANPNSVTWLGHASFFARVDGVNILIDPFLSPRAASIQPFGAPRLRPPALTVNQLPSIDMLLITHAHYDHCDRTTLKNLPNKKSIRVFVPSGMGPLLRGWGFTDVSEMPWHLSITTRTITITCVPAVHHSRRGFFDYNRMLWGGFIISGSQKRIYMAGDTAYGSIFKEMGVQYGPCDIGLVPIGGYGADNHLQSVHATPEDACKIGRDMKCTQLVGMHWGALGITSEPPLEPRTRFHAAGATVGYAPDAIITPDLGDTIPL